jgi:hypothetical protein
MEESKNQEVEVPQVEEIIPESWKSNEIDKLASALAKAQTLMDGAQKSSTNPFFNSGYADLHTCIKSSFPALNKHGLSIVQGNEVISGAVCVTTTLLHESGQWLRSKLKVPMAKIDAQGVGSAITYGRRYGLAAMAGIAQKDDDGNSISKATAGKNPRSAVDRDNAQQQLR